MKLSCVRSARLRAERTGSDDAGQRIEHAEPEGEAKERRHARLVRTMTLPAGIEPQKVEARYHNGVLEGMCLALRQSSRGTLKSRPEVGGCRRSSVSLDGTTSSRKPKPRLPGL